MSYHGSVGLLEEMMNARKKQLMYRLDPGLWAEEVLGVKLWTKQKEIGLSLVHNRSTAVAAGHGVGKSFCTAVFICWWIDVHPLDQVYVASTAPSLDQVGGIIWREVRRLHMLAEARYEEGLIDHKLPGYITGDNKWKTDRGDLLGQGRKPPDSKEESAFQGFHDGFVLAVGDEACGLSGEMIDALSNITSNEDSRRLLIGNPTNPSSHMGTIFREDTGAWNLMHISVFDSPNFHGGGICDCHPDMPAGEGLDAKALAKLSGPSYIEDKKIEYGEDSPRYKSRILGRFAYEAGNTLFTDIDVARAVNAAVIPDSTMKIHLGVDVARFGPDSTYVYAYEEGEAWITDGDGKLKEGLGKNGGRLRLADSWREKPITNDDPADPGSAELIHKMALKYSAATVRVDASGVGGGVIDRLLNLAGDQYLVIEMMGGGASPDRRQWLNNRAFQYDSMRRRFANGLIDIDPEDQKLRDELLGIIYDFADGSSGGGLKIESKESIKKRGGKSPDAADAAWYACAELNEILAQPAAGSVIEYDMPDAGVYGWSW